MPSLGWQELIILVIIFGIPALAVLLGSLGTSKSRKPYASSKQTSFSVNRVLELARQAYSVNGYQVASQTEQNIALIRQVRPNIAILILMFMAGIMPAVIYLVLSNRNILVNISATPHASGSAVNIVSSVTGFGARRMDDHFLSSLPTVEASSYEDV